MRKQDSPYVLMDKLQAEVEKYYDEMTPAQREITGALCGYLDDLPYDFFGKHTIDELNEIFGAHDDVRIDNLIYKHMVAIEQLDWEADKMVDAFKQLGAEEKAKADGIEFPDDYEWEDNSTGRNPKTVLGGNEDEDDESYGDFEAEVEEYAGDLTDKQKKVFVTYLDISEGLPPKFYSQPISEINKVLGDNGLDEETRKALEKWYDKEMRPQ